MKTPLDVVGLQMDIIKQGLQTEEKLTEGGDEDAIRDDESERDFFPEPELYGEGEGRGSDWDR